MPNSIRIGHLFPLVPAKAGTHLIAPPLDSRLRGNERFNLTGAH